MSSVSIAGGDAKFECSREDTLLRGALRAGLQFPYECNSGGCGCCKIKLLEGEVENLFPDAPGLSERDTRKGMVLACQNRCTSSRVQIKTSVEAWNANLCRPTRFTATLVSRIDIARDLAEFVFSVDREVSYRPGQFFMFDFPGVGERAYSNASYNCGAAELRFVVKKMPGGRASSHLFASVRTGDEFSCDGPYGHSYFRESSHRDVVLIAGGSGLSPMMSIIRYLATQNSCSRKIQLFYGAKSLAELNESYVIREAADLGERFSMVTALSGDDKDVAGWEGSRGFIHDVLRDTLDEFGNKEFYFCGPPVMTSAVQKLLMLEKQVPYEQVHFDRFF